MPIAKSPFIYFLLSEKKKFTHLVSMLTYITSPTLFSVFLLVFFFSYIVIVIVSFIRSSLDCFFFLFLYLYILFRFLIHKHSKESRNIKNYYYVFFCFRFTKVDFDCAVANGSRLREDILNVDFYFIINNSYYEILIYITK